MTQKRILLLGSGFVAGPFVSYMLRRPENFITVACRHLEAAEKLAGGRANTAAIALDATDAAALEKAVSEHDIIISLIPYTNHPLVIDAAVKCGKHFVSTSYVSPAMAAFDQAAKDKGLTVLNEVGVDPGIDHLYAVKIITETHAAGGKVREFTSFCGGLPAPEDSNNPLGYKFSWSPRGVLLAIRNVAKYKENGQIVEIAAKDLLKSARPVYIYPAFAFMGYGNRDSTPYEQRYNIPEAETILRGSLRYQGNPAFMQAVADCGFLNVDAQSFLAADAPAITWRAVMKNLLGASSDEESALCDAVAAKANLEGAEKKRILRGFKWLGLFSDTEVERRGTYLDTLCATLEVKMAYQPGERDMIMMQHKFEITRADGSEATITSTMVEYGQPDGETAMARTVGVPCAVATQLILDGKITRRGVLAPLTPDIYEPMIEILEKEGLKCVEEVL